MPLRLRVKTALKLPDILLIRSKSKKENRLFIGLWLVMGSQFTKGPNDLISSSPFPFQPATYEDHLSVATYANPEKEPIVAELHF